MKQCTEMVNINEKIRGNKTKRVFCSLCKITLSKATPESRKSTAISQAYMSKWGTVIHFCSEWQCVHKIFCTSKEIKTVIYCHEPWCQRFITIQQAYPSKRGKLTVRGKKKESIMLRKLKIYFSPDKWGNSFLYHCIRPNKKCLCLRFPDRPYEKGPTQNILF